MPEAATPNQGEREFETGTDEAFKNANASGSEAHSVRLLATRRREITMNNNEASADTAAAMRARCARRARILHSKCSSFGWGCVGKLSHDLSSFAQRRADAATLCAGHKKARSDPPGRDTHSYDDGLNTQDSVTQVNPFSANCHARAGTIIAIRTNWNMH